MGFLDRLLGREEPTRDEPNQRPAAPAGQAASARTDDEIAVERYQYLLRTAPPETIEKVHAEAFAKLTDEQRELLFTRLSENADERERPANAEPATLAKAATRAELREPGTLTRTFGGQGQGGMGFGSLVGGTILGTVAGYVIGSALVSAFLPDPGATDAAASDPGADSGSGSGADSGSDSGADAGTDTASDAGSGDSGAGDQGAGDFGGGDFGGGDFGGGFDF
jgi:hypothetical protein